MKTYILLKNDTINHYGRTLYRVKYVDGILGGYIENEKNLEHGNARVLGNAWVCDNTCVFGNAEVY